MRLPPASFLVLMAVLAGLAFPRPVTADSPEGKADDRTTGSAYLRAWGVSPQPFGEQVQGTFPYDGVRIQRWRREQPPVEWLVVWIDLKTPGLGYAVSPIHLRTGPGGVPIQAAYAQTTENFLAEGRSPRVDLAVNTVAYWSVPAFDRTPVFLSEPVWVGPDRGRDPEPGTLMLGLGEGEAQIGEPDAVRAAKPSCAFGSFTHLDRIPGGVAVRDGQALQYEDDWSHARTAVGVSEDGRVLIWLLADGYNPGVSEGMSLEDTSRALRAAGAHQAIFLDGGGSTALVGRDHEGRPEVVNRPAGLLTTPGTLRYVAVNLGFTGLRRTDEPLPSLPDWEAPLLTRAWCQAATWFQADSGWGTAAVVGSLLGLTLVLWRLRRRRLAPSGTSRPAPRPAT